MTTEDDSLQISLSAEHPMIYGKMSWPVIILFVMHLAILVTATSEIFILTFLSKNKENRLPITFLAMLFCFSLIHTLSMTVPLPWNIISYLLVLDELPRFLLILGFEFLGLWMGRTIFSIHTKNRRTLNWIGVILIVIVLLLLISTTVINILEATIWFTSHTPHQHNITTIFIQIPTYVIIIISNIVYFARLLYLIVSGRVDKPMRVRMWLLTIVVAAILIIFALRMLYSILVICNVNTMSAFLIQKFTEGMSGKSPLSVYYLYYLLFEVIFDILPATLLIVQFLLLAKETNEQLKKKVYRADVGYLIPKTTKHLQNPPLSGDSVSTTSIRKSRSRVRKDSSALRKPLFQDEEKPTLAPIRITPKLAGPQRPIHVMPKESYQRLERPQFVPIGVPIAPEPKRVSRKDLKPISSDYSING
ncbi:hypothetical protein BLNAU_2290 [Blattamonas nauphoetae]|uniref:Uncharacterized protein n=1 Tax=Blattamonas nauphoetae TaxID=2049346 RepID=A0ABQ9YGS0_9EUKA|nr:hypothetical protein BLNAU_2290 [Blattamonas nauphoetae]